jgi:7,8-dihydropterin-6-yl-methyl-4-(beta-D-ribofuranosyl)aminobenzene 5'-phosphate synthase
MRLKEKTEDADIKNIKLTVIYDNVRYEKGLRADWGFSCLVEGLDKTILFDTGRFDDIWISNMSKFGIEPDIVEELVVSHDHPDHVGGVMKFLELRPDINVTLVKSFRSGFKKAVSKLGSEVIEIDQPGIVSKNCLSTGEMKSFVKNEHSLVILTNRGLIILTGCAHPGVIDIVERARKITNKEVLLLAGGFHLLADHESSLRKIAEQINAMGVNYVAPSHCSGGQAMKILAEVYGKRFLNSGLGRIITSKDFHEEQDSQV